MSGSDDARLFLLDGLGISHIGNKREENQDDYLVDVAAGLFAVADGVGGLTGGQQASRAVIAALSGLGEARDMAALRQTFERQITAANAQLRDLIAASGNALGTTLAALLIRNGRYLCAWAGDSRIYLVREGRIAPLTQDHNEANELLRQGTLNAEEARVWPRRHVITRAIGAQDEIELEFRDGEILARDLFLLCSDGLTTHLSDPEILGAIEGRTLDEAAEALIGQTLQRGGSDNVTVILVAIRAVAPTPAGTPRERTVQLIPRQVRHD